MSRTALLFACLAALTLASCGKQKKPDAQLYSAGEKAQVGSLSYSLIDSQIIQQIGDDPATARTPQNRFILVQISVTNAGNAEAPIPGLTLVDDSGQVYNELPDGTGIERWLGVVRKVVPAQTETGIVIFDAPAKHYRLRLTDEFAEAEVGIDMPLDFLHEQMQHMGSPVQDPPPPPAGDVLRPAPPPEPPATKK
jgi:hypothetical protein